jgi:cysteinyl-tRNA synthetase
LTAWDIAKKYEDNFMTYLKALNIQFDAHPRATDYIPQQIAIVQQLEHN